MRGRRLGSFVRFGGPIGARGAFGFAGFASAKCVSGTVVVVVVVVVFARAFGSFSSTILSFPVDLSVRYFVSSSSKSPNSLRYIEQFSRLAPVSACAFSSRRVNQIRRRPGARASARSRSVRVARITKGAFGTAAIAAVRFRTETTILRTLVIVVIVIFAPKISLFQRLCDRFYHSHDSPSPPLELFSSSFPSLSLLFSCVTLKLCSFGMASSTAIPRFAHLSTITLVFNLNLFWNPRTISKRREGVPASARVLAANARRQL